MGRTYSKLYGPSSNVRAAVFGTVQDRMTCAWFCLPLRVVTFSNGAAATAVSSATRGRRGRRENMGVEGKKGMDESSPVEESTWLTVMKIQLVILLLC